MHSSEKLLQRSLYVFDLPEDLLYTLQLQAQPSSVSETTADPLAPPASPTPTKDNATGATSCGLCGLSFTNVPDQRAHVRSDLHGYNLKQKLRGTKPVTEADFERLVGELDESISGSDTSDSEDDSEDELGGSRQKDSTLSALLKKQAKLTDGDAEDAPTKKRKRGAGKPPLIWFSSPKLPPNTSLGVYRAVFSSAEQDQESELAHIIQQKQLRPLPPPPPAPKAPKDDEGGVPLPPSMLPKGTSASGPHYFLCMIGGGHFAAMVVSLTPKLTKKAGVEDRAATVLAHKTFHRYTTRRKQGGSQSSNDNAKGNAHSAGSSLRRYNEVALVEEVRALLADWKALIDSADLLFVRATGSTNRRTLFGPYEGQVLSHRDERIRGFPFSTRRATQSELMRAFVELTRVKVSTINEAALAKQAEEAAAAATKAESTAKPSQPKAPKPSKADEEAVLHTTQLQALIRRSKAPGLLSYLQTNNLSPDFRFFPPESNHQSPTPLHLAATSASAICVSALLLKASADPSVANANGRRPFEIAADRATRDAFRLARSQLGESRWDWEAAGVAAGLTQTEVEARAARDRAEKDAEEAAEKQRRQTELERLRKEDEEKRGSDRDRKFGKGQVLSAPPKMTAEERRVEEARGMTEEMKLRLEREKRARAAEERMRRLQGK